jgi:ribonuclease HI
MFTDAARRQIKGVHKDTTRESGGCAIVYRPPGDVSESWLSRAWGYRQMPTINHGEMLAIAEAIHTALKYAEAETLRGGTITIFSDAKDCLRLLRYRNTPDMWRVEQQGDARIGIDLELLPIVEAIIWASQAIRTHNCELEIRWIPGHMHYVWPHELADRLSRDMYTGGRSARAMRSRWRDWGPDDVAWRDCVAARLI